MSRFSEFISTLEQKKGQRNLLLEQKLTEESNLSKYKKEAKNIERAQFIIQEVAKETQSEIKIYLSNLISLALASIYDDPYTFELEFIEKRGRTEAQPLFVRNGKKYIPAKQTGGGPTDIASFALRLSLWCLDKHNISNTFIMDEPFSNLDEEALPKAAELLNYLSDKLKLQFIIITHDKALACAADKIFEIEKKEK